MAVKTMANASVTQNLRQRARALVLYLVLIAALVSGSAGCKVKSGHEVVAEKITASMIESASLYRLAPGERLVYSLDYSGKSSSDFKALFAGQESAANPGQPSPILTHSFNTSVRGRMQITV